VILGIARSHRRSAKERQTKVFRFFIREARLSASGIELEMYARHKTLVEISAKALIDLSHDTRFDPNHSDPNQANAVRG
jgi:hypothetical protein